MKRIIAMLLVCLMLVQMLPLGIHAHAHETEVCDCGEIHEETIAVEASEETEATELTEVTEVTPETTEAIPEMTMPAEIVIDEESATVIDLSEFEDETATIRVEMTKENGEWVMTSAEEVELPEGFDLNRMDEMSGFAVGDNLYKEKENNNTTGSANIVYNDYTVQGTLSSSDLPEASCRRYT